MSGYLARQEIERITAVLARDPLRLEPHGFKVYSQGDEDGIIEEIFRRLDVAKGSFCEIGVENGLECNTLYLIHKGWTGCWIEGNPDHVSAIGSTFGAIMPARLCVRNALVTAENINQLIAGLTAPGRELDFLSIDVDGNDVHLLRALQARPTVICIEYNAKFPANLSKRQVYDPACSWRGTDYMGSSLKGICEVAQAMNYRLVGTSLTGANAFFVRADMAGQLFPEDASPEHLYNPPRYHLILDHYRTVGHPADFGPYEDLAG